MAKISIAVLMGGRSSEYEISLLSGQEVVKSLDTKKYDVFPIIFSKSAFSYSDAETLLSKKYDVVFIAMHGSYGEDGTLQGLLELSDIVYTGPGVLASALGMDKLRFRKLLKAENIQFPRFIEHKSGESLKKIDNELGSSPYVVKPHNQGSSVGVSIVQKKAELLSALEYAHQYSDCVLVDEYIKGMEITCSIIGNENPRVLPLIEIVPANQFFDYESKYTSKKTQEIVPARISKKLTAKIQKIALAVYEAVGAVGFSRVDFIISESGEIFVLEINTIPGLTAMSLLPKAALAAGISYPELIEIIISLAREK